MLTRINSLNKDFQLFYKVCFRYVQIQKSRKTHFNDILQVLELGIIREIKRREKI